MSSNDRLGESIICDGEDAQINGLTCSGDQRANFAGAIVVRAEPGACINFTGRVLLWVQQSDDLFEPCECRWCFVGAGACSDSGKLKSCIAKS